MKITLIRKDEEQGTEALSLCDSDAFLEKIKTENKAGHISELREILPRLTGSSAHYAHIDKLPRVYPAVEYTRKQNGEKRMKHYNGLVQLEVNRLADQYETPSSTTATDLCRFLRFKRTERKDMGTLRTPRRHSAHHTGGSPVSCSRLSAGGDLLPAHASFRHHTEGTGPDAKLPHDRG